MGLWQGRRRVSDYAIEFLTLSMDSGWSVLAVLDAYQHGLAPSTKDQFVSIDLPDNLDVLNALTIKINKRRLETEKERLGWRTMV